MTSGLKEASCTSPDLQKLLETLFDSAGPAACSQWSWAGRVTLNVGLGPEVSPPGAMETPFRKVSDSGSDWQLRIRQLSPEMSQRAFTHLAGLDLLAGYQIGCQQLFGEMREGAASFIALTGNGKVDALLLEGAADYKHLAALRLFRNAFAENARQTAAHLHASAAVCGDGATLICGPSGSGKTTLLLTAMAQGYDFLANDDCFYFPDGTLLGLPVAIGIRNGTMASLPALADLHGKPAANLHRPFEPHESTRRTMSAAELTHRLGRKITASARIEKLCILHPSKEPEAYRLIEISPQEAASNLLDNMHPIVNEHQLWWDSNTVPISKEALLGIRCFQAEVGPKALPTLANALF